MQWYVAVLLLLLWLCQAPFSLSLSSCCYCCLQLGKFGVTDVAMFDDWLYTSGSNGVVRALPLKW